MTAAATFIVLILMAAFAVSKLVMIRLLFSTSGFATFTVNGNFGSARAFARNSTLMTLSVQRAWTFLAHLRQGFACLLDIVSLGLRMDPNTSNMLLWLLGAVFGTNSLVAALLIRGICVGIVAVVFTSLAEFTLCGRALKLHICAHRMRRCIELKSVFSPKSFKSVPALSAAF